MAVTDVLDRAQAWLKSANERGINVTDDNGYLAVISDLVAERDRLRSALVAAMKVVNDEIRRITPYDGEPLPVRLCDMQRINKLKAIIAQADAALGAERD